jgi:hypothetical protein
MNPILHQGIGLVAMFAMSAVGYAQSADGADPDAEIDSGFSGEIRFIAMQSRDKSVQKSLFTKELYLELALADGFSAFGAAYHDKEFESAYLGVARQFGDFQVAIGAGKARYDDISHFVLNPWLYYQANQYTGLLTVEHYSNESDDPWYYKGYIERKVSERYYIGAFGEKGIGVGPMLGMYLGSQVNVWASAPIIYRPSQGGMQSLLGLTFEF